MEDEDLEETNNEDCGQRARRLATLRKRRQREDRIESRPYSTCVSLYTSYDIFTVLLSILSSLCLLFLLINVARRLALCPQSSLFVSSRSSSSFILALSSASSTPTYGYASAPRIYMLSSSRVAVVVCNIPKRYTDTRDVYVCA